MVVVGQKVVAVAVGMMGAAAGAVKAATGDTSPSSNVRDLWYLGGGEEIGWVHVVCVESFWVWVWGIW